MIVSFEKTTPVGLLGELIITAFVLEEIAYLNGWISKEELQKAYELYQKNQYGKYLKDVLEGKYID